MEDLFRTNLSVNNKDVVYHIVFDHEKYIFQPESPGDNLPSFSLKREHDEWHEQDKIDPSLKEQAIDELEAYLLKQH